jgi:GNAT superfamily N-acetyltransferase
MEIEHNTDDLFDIFELSSTAEELFYDEIFYHDITMEHFVLWHEVVVEPEYRKQGLGRS